LQIRLRILLFSSVTFKTPTKTKYFYANSFEGTFTLFFKDKKEAQKHTDPVDPDPAPEHCRRPINYGSTGFYLLNRYR
jgi:hypothetical protein